MSLGLALLPGTRLRPALGDAQLRPQSSLHTTGQTLAHSPLHFPLWNSLLCELKNISIIHFSLTLFFCAQEQNNIKRQHSVRFLLQETSFFSQVNVLSKVTTQARLRDKEQLFVLHTYLLL